MTLAITPEVVFSGRVQNVADRIPGATLITPPVGAVLGYSNQVLGSTDVAAMETLIGRSFKGLRQNQNISVTGWTTAISEFDAGRRLTYRAIQISSGTWADVASGTSDSAIATIAANLVAAGRWSPEEPAWLCFHHEATLNSNDGFGDGQDYIDAWRRFRDVLDAGGYTVYDKTGAYVGGPIKLALCHFHRVYENVLWDGSTETPPAGKAYADFDPDGGSSPAPGGTSYYEAVGNDPYNEIETPGTLKYGTTAAGLIVPTWDVAVSNGKPMFFGEFGCEDGTTHADHVNKAMWLDSCREFFAAHDSDIDGRLEALLLTIKTSAENYNIDSSPESIAAFQRLAASGSDPTVLYLDNVYDFDEDGGIVTISDATNSEPIQYTSLDDETASLQLVSAPTNTFETDGTTYAAADPEGLEKVAYVVRDDVPDEQIPARVPHRWYDVMPEGIRDPDGGEAVTLRFDGVDWLVDDILGQTPVVDGSVIDPGTLPPPTVTDGDPPASSPTPVVSGGIGTIFVTWVAVSNADPVTYEVHLSTSSGFTPGPTTKAAETGGTLIALHALPDATPLDYATTYYVKLIAVDTDGSAAAGAQGSGSPVQVNTPDIAVDAITAGTIQANAVTAEKLESVLALVSTLIAGTPDASRVELGVGQDDPSDIGIRAYDSLGVPTARIDGQDGSVYIRGRLDFGQGSRLLANDIVELHKQAITGVQTPARVQQNGRGKRGSSDIDNITATWPSATVGGSLLIAVVCQKNSGGGSTPRTPVASGWTQVQTSFRGSGPIMRQTIFKIEGSSARAGTELFDFTSGGASATRYATVEILEYAGVDAQDVLVAATGGVDASVEFGSTGALAQAGEVELAFVSTMGAAAIVANSFTDGYAFVADHIITDDVGIYTATCAVAERITTDTADGTTTADLIGSFGGPEWLSSIVTFKASAAGALPPGDADILRVYTEDDTGGPVLHVQDSAAIENSLLMAPSGEGWRIEVLPAAVNLASLAATSGATIDVALTGVQTGDIVVWIGTNIPPGDGRQFIHYVDPSSITTNQVTLIYFNADDAARNPDSATHYFLVIHRT